MRMLCAMLLATVLAAHGQSAKVIQLSAADAAQAKDLQKQQDDLAAKVKAFRTGIVERYLVTANEHEGGGTYYGLISGGYAAYAGCFVTINGTTGGILQATSCNESETPAERAKRKKEEAEYKAKLRWYKKGWEGGLFEYSDDYLFIVPEPAKPAAVTSINPCDVQLTGNN